MDNDFFQNKVVIITGGSRGIGYETAQAFLEKKAKVAICSQNPFNLKEAEKNLKKKGFLLARVVDVGNPEQIKDFVKEIIEKFKKIDILINNAGVLWSGEFKEQTLESIDHIINVNIKGVLYVTRLVLPFMIEQKSGIIINISSGAGKAGIPKLACYCASKFAINGFTESLAQEVEKYGILVYALCPGKVATDMQIQFSGKKIGMPPQKIAQKIIKLCKPNHPISSGQCLEIYNV